MNYTEEQLKAAYALNLCTVSVSQIIDYNDVNIMEQEYEAILNNLNLEQMPKDEALLNILKQLLNTITFFRISDKEREFIEKEYQMKMKNSVWSAVPNISMFFSGGDWISTTIAVVSQIGIGYMNYRRAKAEGAFEKEKKLWELERSAIEQFNGLRRELFDTAWRLSSVYAYPDELRLSERQISQYNNILMDTDPVSRYERLDSVKEYFLAYPPFWYYMGHTLAELSTTEISISPSKKLKFREEAKNCFQHFRATNQKGLLREDPIASSCALELIDLLDSKQDRELITELILEAYKFSGRKEDILQFCAINYLRIGDNERASKILLQLINENYLPYMNAQLLSTLYVSSFINHHSTEAVDKYNLLQRKIGIKYLFPMPDNYSDKYSLSQNFIKAQQEILVAKYQETITEFCDKYKDLYEALIPVNSFLIRKDDCNSSSTVILTRNELLLQINEVFKDQRKASSFVAQLKEIDIRTAIIDFLNRLFKAVCELIFVNNSVQIILAKDIENAISAQRVRMNSLVSKLQNNKFGVNETKELLDISYSQLTFSFFSDLVKEMNSYLNSLSEMQDFAIAEQSLSQFCRAENLQDPDEVYAKSNIFSTDIITAERKFTYDLWEERGSQYASESLKFMNLLRIIEKYENRIIIDTQNAVFFSSKDPRTNRYFSSNSKLYNYTGLKKSTIGILDSKGRKGGFDLVFTNSGIIPYKDNIVLPLVSYNDVSWTNDNKALLIGSVYKGYVANLKELYSMILELAPNSISNISNNKGLLETLLGAIGIKV